MVNEKLLDSVGSLVGAAVSIDPEIIDFINKSREKAMSYEWLYHCTTAETLLNIISSGEFWITNLKYVNDPNESKRIDKEFENTFYVGSFTYDENINTDHWKEYGTISNGVIVGLKQSWFQKKAYFISMNGKHMEDDVEYLRIYPSYDDVLRRRCNQLIDKNRMDNSYYLGDFSFYQVVYDDKMVKSVYTDSSITTSHGTIQGKAVFPEVAGIIKNKSGICERNGEEPYEKNWESEKEVRLKLRIHQCDHIENGNEYHDSTIVSHAWKSVAVPLSDDAFSEVRIGFSPDFNDPEGYIKKLKDRLGEVPLHILPINLIGANVKMNVAPKVPKILFPGKRKVNWDDVEQYMAKYRGKNYTVESSGDVIYLDKRFEDEYCGSVYSSSLMGTLAKAKANAAQIIPELIQSAKNKRFKENLDEKHSQDASKGWYRYDVSFQVPVCNDKGEVERYNTFRGELLVRHASNDKMYLYDMVRIKKKREPHHEPED